MQSRDLDALLVTHLPNVRYLANFVGTAGALLLTRTSGCLIVDFRYSTAGRLAIARGDLAEVVEVVVSDTSAEAAVLQQLRSVEGRRIGIEGASMVVSRFNHYARQLSESTAEVSSRGPRSVLAVTERLVEQLRAVKDAPEIATLREAAVRLAIAAREVPGFAQVGRTEMEVAADIDALLRRTGFEKPAFETIVASGPNSALPHARPTARRLEAADGVVLDFGGVYDGYSVDLTRTVQLGQTSAALGRMFDAVAEAQRLAIAAVRPGVLASDVDRAARDTLTSHGLGEAFGHGTGHGLGLEVHEEPRIGRAVAEQVDAVLEVGMVFTIEPGAYVEGVGGVRIEDDVLVTEGGCEVLTQPTHGA
jgi:Xaa-Pro aminopeptidase